LSLYYTPRINNMIKPLLSLHNRNQNHQHVLKHHGLHFKWKNSVTKPIDKLIQRQHAAIYASLSSGGGGKNGNINNIPYTTFDGDDDGGENAKNHGINLFHLSLTRNAVMALSVFVLQFLSYIEPLAAYAVSSRSSSYKYSTPASHEAPQMKVDSTLVSEDDVNGMMDQALKLLDLVLGTMGYSINDLLRFFNDIKNGQGSAVDMLPQAAGAVVSAVSGLFMTRLAKMIGKTLLIVATSTALIVQVLAKQGYVTIHWDRFQETFQQYADPKHGKLDIRSLADIRRIREATSVISAGIGILYGRIPNSLAFVAGILWGIL